MKRILLIALLALSFAFAQSNGQGGILKVSLQTQPTFLNPLLTGELSSGIVNWALFAPLTAANPETFEIVPYLATHWDVNEDATEWTFYLHPDATWHDGTPVTADDVKWTFERILDPEENVRSRRDVVDFLDHVEVVDEKTVRFILQSPNSLLPAVMSYGGLEPLPRHVFEGFDSIEAATDANTQLPIGSGAFKMKEVVPGSYIELEANTDFFLGQPKVDGILFRIVPDINVRVAQLLAGDLDWTSIAAINVAPIEANPNVSWASVTNSRYKILDWNNSDLFPFFQDAQVKKAFIHAVDRESILRSVAQGRGEVVDRFVPEEMSAWMPVPSTETYTYDPELAKQLLTEAGWTDTNGDGVREKEGADLSFYILVDKGNTVHEQVGLILQQSFEEIGVEVEYVVAERNGRWLEETVARTFPTRMTDKTVPHPAWMQRYFTTNGIFNNGLYSNERVDTLLSDVFTTSDLEQQGRIFEEVQEILYNDPPFLVLFHLDELVGFSTRVQDLPMGEIKLSMPFAYLISIDD